MAAPTTQAPTSRSNGAIKSFPSPSQLATPTDLKPDEVRAITEALNPLVADAFALYLKTKNFHWHMSGSHFRDYHLLLDEHADAIFATTDVIAERVRRIGGTTIRSIGHVAQLQRVQDSNEEYVAPGDMILQLLDENKAYAKNLRARARGMRGQPRCGQREFARSIHRRDRAPHLVPL